MCKEMAGKASARGRSRKNFVTRHTQQDEKATQIVMETVTIMINPFESEGNELVQISSGVVASNKVRGDLTIARQIEDEACMKFSAVKDYRVKIQISLVP